MYIHNSYQATVIYNGSKEDSDNHFENIIIELTKNECKFVVCGVYRHPSYLLTNFNKIFEDFLVQHFNKLINNDCWILADFNADISKYNNISEITLFLDNLLNLNFLPLITLPTRITKTSSTILDHIYLRPALNNKSSNINTSNLNVGCLVTDITDHIGIFSFLTLDKKRDVVNKERPLVRIFSKSNKIKFNNELASIDWNPIIYQEQCVDLAYENFIDAFNMCYESCFPLVRLSRSKNRDKNWITPELKASCNNKSKKYKKWIQSKKEEDLLDFKKFASKHNKLIREAERQFYEEVFNAIKNDIKKLWSEINKIGNFKSKNQHTTSVIKNIVIDGVNRTQPNEISEGLNNYFCNMGQTLNDKLPSKQITDSLSLSNSVISPFTFVFDPITITEIINTIFRLKNRKSVGADNISTKIIFDVKETVSPILHFII